MTTRMPRAKCAAGSLAGLLSLILVCPALSQDKLPGITRPAQLRPYDSTAMSCSAPPSAKKVLGFAQDNRRQFMVGVSRGLEAAAGDRSLTYKAYVADNDPAKMLEHLEIMRGEAGGVVVAPVDPISTGPLLQDMISSGIYVGAVVPPPAVTILNAPQYLTGKVLGDAAAEYIRSRLGGKAKVVLLTHDSLQFLAPRFAAMRDSLRDIPGVTIVADISPLTVDEAGGAAMMRTVLLANPEIDVVLGADTVVLGALDELRAAGRARPDQFLGGIDGEPRAVAEIKSRGPYKATVSLASPVFGYALGYQAADWLEGKSVPQAMDILPRAITPQTIAEYEADVLNPGAVYANAAKRDSYLKMYGNICYDTRDQYINFPWSSERQ